MRHHPSASVASKRRRSSPSALQAPSARRRIQRALRESEDRFKLVAAHWPVVSFYHDRQLRYVWIINPLGARSAEEVIGKTDWDLFAPDEARHLTGIKRRVLETGETYRGEQLLTFADTPCWYEVIYQPERDRGGRVVGLRGCARDITERKRFDESLREAQKRTESILASVADVHILFDREWRYVYVNDAAARAINRPRDQIVGSTLWEMYPDIIGTDLEREYRRAMEQRVAVAFEFHYLALDSWWDNRFNPVPEGLAVFATDITERKRAEEARRQFQQQLRVLSSHLETVREEERSRIAREIHDELGQVLTGLKIELSVLDEAWSKRAPRDGPVGHEAALRRMVTLVDDSIQSVRKIATELRPMILDRLGLFAAIEWQADEFVKSSGIRCDVRLPDTEVAEHRQTSTALFRILQESLTNIVRHAKARNVVIRVWNEDHATVLQVTDDGIGIPAHLVDRETSFGLLSMKERAVMLGGSLDVAKGGAGGTTITARVPRIG